jgi:hypothetical protein
VDGERHPLPPARKRKGKVPDLRRQAIILAADFRR